MTYLAGDAVHVIGLGKGTVREVLNSGRLRVEVKGRVLIATSAQLTRTDPSPRPRAVEPPGAAAEPPAQQSSAPPARVRSLDLHGRTVHEAAEEVQAFLNGAILDGEETIRIIHGRSGGRLKNAVHAQLRATPVQSFRLDPRNPGVTIVVL